MWVSFDMAIYAYLYVYIGRIYFRVALIQKYIYMEVFSMQPRFSFLHVQLWGYAKMKFLCWYSNNKTCSPTSYVYI